MAAADFRESSLQPISTPLNPGGLPGREPSMFGAASQMIVQQETNMCCRYCCCQPNIDFKMANYEVDNFRPGQQIEKTWSIKEDASRCGRCWSVLCPGARRTKWTVTEEQTGATVMTHEKEPTCSHCFTLLCSDEEFIRVPCCCFLPYLDTFDEHHNKIGTTKYICDLCPFVPKFDVFDARGERVVRIRPDTCCLGCCPRCRCKQDSSGRGRLRLPYVIREPQPPFEPIGTPQGNAAINEVWIGMWKERCMHRHVFSVNFPPPQHMMHDDPTSMKKLLIGAGLLLQMLMYEHRLRDKNKNQGHNY